MREPPALPSPIHSCLPSYDGPGRGLFVAMILTCPSCGTQYVVKDGAIPPEGRQVRCAACKHSWHQNPDAEAAEDAPESPETVPADDVAPVAEPQAAADQEGENFAEAALIDPRSGPEAEERAYEEAVVEGETGPETEAAAAAEDCGETPTAYPAPTKFRPFSGED